jgi:hypothetical protein
MYRLRRTSRAKRGKATQPEPRRRRKPNRSDLIASALRKPASGYALRRFPQRTCFLYTSFQPVDDNRLGALVIIQRAATQLAPLLAKLTHEFRQSTLHQGAR